jgi:hypothetical protein
MHSTRALAAGVMAVALAACGRDLPMQPGEARTPDGPSLLLTPACAGFAGQTHPAGSITTLITWTRANSPHRVTGNISIQGGGRLAVAAGAVVCFEPGTRITAESGGRLVAVGRDTAQILFTARDPVPGWEGLHLSGAPTGYSQLKNVRIEHVARLHTAVTAIDLHQVVVDSIHIRQSGQGLRLLSPRSSIARSRVDTTTYRAGAAVELADSTRFVATTVRRAAGVGVLVSGAAGVWLYGGRIEGSGGVGLRVPASGALYTALPLRITGGGSYPAELTAGTLAKIYPLVGQQDSLLGNARDTLSILAGPVSAAVAVRAGLPWHVRGEITMSPAAILTAQPGARLVFDEGARLHAGGGRVRVRGTPAARVVFTADDPAVGWAGIWFETTTPTVNYLANVVIEHVGVGYTAVTSRSAATVYVDSAILRQNGRAAALAATSSRLYRSRVDTTLSGLEAVELRENARIESTLIRGSSGAGLGLASPNVVVVSCEVRESTTRGIVMYFPVPVHNCNLVNNYGAGVFSASSTNLENNWWGDPAGPFGPNGDGIEGAPQDFTPWRTTPYVLPYVP